jgi:hypothetical protein
MLPALLALLSPLGVVLDPTSTGDGVAIEIDARWSFIASDDNLAAGSLGRSSVGLLTAPARRLSFEDIERRDIAYDRDFRLMLIAEYAETSDVAGFFAGFLPRLALRDPNASSEIDWSGTAGFLGVRKRFGFGELALTVFPWSGDQIRLGYTQHTSWTVGTRSAFVAPGAQLEWTGFGGYGFVAGTSAAHQMDQTDGTKELGTIWSVVSGVGCKLFDAVNADVEGTYALRGTIDKQELETPTADAHYRVAKWTTYGGAVRLTWSHDVAVATPVGYEPLENDLFAFDSLVADPVPPAQELAWSVVGTGTLLWQTLQNPDVLTELTVQRALAADLIARVQYGHVGSALFATYRDLASLLFDVPSNPPLVAFPKDLKISPEKRLAAQAWLSWLVVDLEAQAEISVGIKWPAFLRTPAEPPDLFANQVMVFNDSSNIEVLDPDERVRPVREAKASLQLRFNRWATAAVDVLGQYDRNLREFYQDAEGIPHRRKQNPLRVGMNFVFRARI